MKKFTLLAAITAALISFGSTSGSAQDHGKMVKAGNLMISGIWARTTPPAAKTGAAYFIIKNTGSVDDVLIGVKGVVSKKTEIHESKMVGALMKMQHVGKIVVSAGGTAELKPGGFHIMFMGLFGPIKEGDMIPLTLNFDKAGEVQIVVPAKKGGSMSKMDHDKKEPKKTGTH